MRLAIVVPRYGSEILGGAETAARSFAEQLVGAGFAVDVLTTCASDIHGTQSRYPPGLTTVHGVSLQRFPVTAGLGNLRAHQGLTQRIAQEGAVTRDDEIAWVDSDFHSAGLYHHLLTHGQVYDLLFFIPYPAAITYYGTALWPERSVIWPCLHDEPFARFLETRQMLASCRGIMYNCEPERAFAAQALRIRNPRSCVVGIGVPNRVGDAEAFRARYRITDPFILYVGRLDPMKNLLEMFSFFLRYKAQSPGPLKLVLVGDGPLAVPKHPDILSLGFIDEVGKQGAYAAALALWQPSLVESFSLVLMESWLNATPVLVNGFCDVTRYHVRESQGGLYYLDFAEFSSTLDWYLTHATGRRVLGLQGRTYVRQTYEWSAVLARFRAALTLWLRV